MAKITTKHVVGWALRHLEAEGWTGGALRYRLFLGVPLSEILRRLAVRGERLRRRYEAECSDEWACNSRSYKAETERQEKALHKACADAGLSLFIQGDPRGATVYVRKAGLPIPDNDYSRVAACLYIP